MEKNDFDLRKERLTMIPIVTDELVSLEMVGIKLNMKVKDFREQINKGLGSEILYLRDNREKSHKYYKAILYACTHNTCYDAQCESERAEYLWEIMKLSIDFDVLQAEVINHLLVAKDWDLLQVYQITKLSVLDGNRQTLELMKKSFGYDECWNTFLGAEEIIDVDGIEGLLFVTEAIGKKLVLDDTYREDEIILEHAYDTLGKENVIAAMEKASRTNVYIKTYINSVNQLMSKREEYQRGIKEYSYEQAQGIINGTINVHNSALMRWGKIATDDEIMKIADSFLKETNRQKLIAYLWIFRRRRFPLEYEKILELAKSNNKQISYMAISALSNISNKKVHDLAVELLLNNSKDYDAIDMLVRNYNEEDYVLLENILYKKYNKDVFHSIGMSILDVYEANRTKNCSNILIELYKRETCSRCRERSIKILSEIKSIPSWILNEAEFDCNLDIRKIIKEYESEEDVKQEI